MFHKCKKSGKNLSKLISNHNKRIQVTTLKYVLSVVLITPLSVQSIIHENSIYKQ